MENSNLIKDNNNSASINFSDIGKINLSEAEKIANEDILFLTEDELITGLEDFELIPLKGTGSLISKSSAALDENQAQEKKKSAEPEKTTMPVNQAQTAASPEEAAELYHDLETEPAVEISDESLEYSADSGRLTAVADESVVELSDDSLDYSADAAGQADDAASDFNRLDATEEKNFIQVKTEESAPAALPESDASGFLYVDDELEGGHVTRQPLRTEAPPPSPVAVTQSGHGAAANDEKNISIELDSAIAKSGQMMDEHPAEPEESAPELTPSIESREILPDDITALDMVESAVRFIDDPLVDKPYVRQSGIFEESDLDSLTSGMVQIITGRPRLLSEAAPDDASAFLILESGAALHTLEHMLLDSDEEYRFKDDEIDYIHSALVQEDYQDYIANIDVFYESIGKKIVTSAVEILGLTRHEIEEIEKEVFGGEFEGVDLYRVFDFYITDRKLRKISESIIGAYTYIQRHSDTLDSQERISIEEDLSSENALIYEEDIEEIRNLFDGSIPKIRHESVELTEEIYDITDKVVILDDDDDIDRFVEEIPGNKRGDVKRLLSYLDGLFEKLPESTIKNFASSEYFNLYVKVLNDLGVQHGTP